MAVRLRVIWLPVPSITASETVFKPVTLTVKKADSQQRQAFDTAPIKTLPEFSQLFNSPSLMV